MKTFTIECVTLETLCEFNKLDIEAVFDKVNSSDISFGNNADTLLTKTQLEYILGYGLDWKGSEDILVSLGS
jgi:hypoxanthine-guanine phosphoribosyltransferase